MNLDRFFGDDSVWEQVAEVAVGANLASYPLVRSAASVADGRRTAFRVRVPKQFPGVQFRKSKRLDDRYERYARDGAHVTGQVEDSGEWLRISSHVYLPIKVGGMTILEEMPKGQQVEGGALSPSPDEACGVRGWWACGQAGESKAAAEENRMEDASDRPPPKVVERMGATQCQRPDEPTSNTAAVSQQAITKPPPADENAAETQRKRPTLFEATRRDPLGDLDEAARHLSDRINPFSDTPRGIPPSRTTWGQLPEHSRASLLAAQA